MTDEHERPSRPRPRPGLLLVLAVLLALPLAGCGGEEAPGPLETTAGDVTEAAADDESFDYEVFLSGAVQDTLRGDAIFGVLENPRTGRHTLVIELVTANSPTGGLYITPGDTTVPEPGAYRLVQRTDTTALGPEEMSISYRKGLLRVLSSRSGSVTLEHASDSLITGSFDAELRGKVVRTDRAPGELPYKGERTVQATGRFRATPRTPGYVVGV